MKKLNQKAMTLVEVIVAVAMLSIVSLFMFSSTMLILNLYSKGQSIYSANSRVSNQVELGEAQAASGKITFRVNGSLVEINGTYYSQTDSGSGQSTTFVLFKPN